MAKKKTESSRRWLKEHFSDPYVKQAQKEGYRSRATFKLLEIQDRSRIFKPGMTVVDLGAAPGGWSQALVNMVKPGKVIAMDILPMAELPGVDFLLGDFTDEAVMHQLEDMLGGQKVDWVISDMAPNTSGHESVDIPRSVHLAELALDFAMRTLKPTGGFLTKVFQGEGFDVFLGEIKQKFKKVSVRKPKASRDRSREVYILATERRE